MHSNSTILYYNRALIAIVSQERSFSHYKGPYHDGMNNFSIIGLVSSWQIHQALLVPWHCFHHQLSLSTQALILS